MNQFIRILVKCITRVKLPKEIKESMSKPSADMYDKLFEEVTE